MKPKATFVLGLPRCGSLALSIINNNPYCYAHHEGLDFDLKPTDFFDETAAGILMNRAHKQGKNYLCCDVSQGIVLVQKYMEWNMACGRAPKDNLQIIRVFTSPTQSTESMSNLLELDEAARKMTHAAIFALLAKITEAAFHFGHDFLVPMLEIHKAGGRFTKEQIRQIADFAGSWPDNDSIERRKMTYLSGVPFSITKKHIDDGVKAMGF